MSLFYNKIIKKEDAVYGGKKILNVTTESNIENEEVDVSNESLEKLEQTEQEINEKLTQAQHQYEEIIANANKEASEIIEKSKNESDEIEKKAYEQGHAQGKQNGYEDGYKEAYENNIEKAKVQAEIISKNASEILIEAKKQVTGYMQDNKENILELSVSIAEQVLRQKLEDTSCMENLILSAINEYELKENFVIKVHPMYKEDLDVQITELKESYKINGDVFVINDESIESGNVVIDTANGRLVLGIDAVLDKIKEELL